MSKQIRFSELVKRSGRPVTVSLWEKPERNQDLMRAVKANRVLTVVQKPTGTQKDFGQVGFHQQPFATYLIFPKPLPKTSDARVVGVDYSQIEEPPPTKASSPPPKRSGRAAALPQPKSPQRVAVSKPPRPQKVIPAEITFEISVLRTAVEKKTVIVTAPTKSAATEKALQAVARAKFQADPAEIRNEIEAIAPVGE